MKTTTTMSVQKRHEACAQLARAAKAHLGLPRTQAAAVLQSRYNYYQTFLEGDLIALCKREGIELPSNQVTH